MSTNAFKGVFREESWAAPLLVMSVMVLCALLLYTVICFCSWIKPTASKSATLLPWLQMPFLLGLMGLASISIVSAVPFSDASCRTLFLGPGLGYVLLAAGLMSRIVQLTTHAHVVLQWLLLFFVVLNQVVISVAYLFRSTQKTCHLIVNDQLLMMLYPGLLVAVVMLLVYRAARRTRSRWKSRESIHIGLAATFSGAFGGCWLGAAAVLGDSLLPTCLGYGSLTTVVVVSLISLIPRHERDPPFPSSSHINRGYSHHDSDRGEIQQPKFHPGPGRGVAKQLPSEPEIIIVPITPGSKVPLSEIALHAYKNHRHHHAPRRTRSDSYRAGAGHRESGRHQHLAESRSRVTGKLSSDLAVSRKIKSIRSRKEATSRGMVRNIAENKGQQRTPYNHRGWLY